MLLQCSSPEQLRESISAGLNWMDNEPKEGPDLLPSFQVPATFTPCLPQSCIVPHSTLEQVFVLMQLTKASLHQAIRQPQAAYCFPSQAYNQFLLLMQPQENAASSAPEAPAARPPDAPRPGFTHLQPLLSPFQDTELQRSFHSTQQNGHAAEPSDVSLPFHPTLYLHMPSPCIMSQGKTGLMHFYLPEVFPRMQSLVLIASAKCPR